MQAFDYTIRSKWPFDKRGHNRSRKKKWTLIDSHILKKTNILRNLRTFPRSVRVPGNAVLNTCLMNKAAPIEPRTRSVWHRFPGIPWEMISIFHLFLVSLLLARPSNPLLKLGLHDLKENSNTIFSVTPATSSSTATPGSVTLPMTTPRWRRLPLQREKEENILELLLRGYIDRQLLEEERALVTASPNNLPQSRLKKGDDFRNPKDFCSIVTVCC